MAFFIISSAVVTTLLLDWKARCRVIRVTISVAISTLDASRVYPATSSKIPVPGAPSIFAPASVVAE